MNQLEKAVADLRHAYHQLTDGVVKDQAKFADGLIAPAIYRIEQALAVQPKQEPVVWRYDREHYDSFPGISTKYSPIKLSIGENWTPLYTAPQPQRDDTALLRQALEALEEGDTVFYPKTKIAIAALRERLK